MLHTVKEAADLLSVSQPSVRKWIATGRLAVVHLGRSVRIPRSELLRIIHEGTIESTQ